MNTKRKKQLAELATKLEEIQRSLEEIQDEEQDYYDNIPENLQDSERAQTSDNCLDLLTTSIDTLIEVIEHLEDIQNQ